MKKVLSFVIAICVLFSCATFVSAADYSLVINNNVAIMAGKTNAIAYNMIVTLPVAPVVQDGVLYAPVRFISEVFNGTVSWDEAKQEVSIDFGGERTAQMVIGSNHVSVNGQVYIADGAPMISNGYTMLPVEFLATTVLGKYVYYDESTGLAVIMSRKLLTSRDTEAIATIASAITSGTMPEITITASVETGGTTSSGGIGGAETGKLNIVSVSADQEPESDNNANCMIDGSTSTRWASQGSANAICDLGSAKPVTHVKVAVWKPTERSTNYTLAVSSNGSSYTTIFSGSSSGSTWDSYDVNDTIRYVKISPNGTSAGDWASILELEVYNGEATATTTTTGGVSGSVITSPTGTKQTIATSSITVTQEPEADNNAANLVDGATATVWASQGEASATFDLGSAKTVTCVGVSMKEYEDDRTIPYDIYISSDGSNFTQVWSGESDIMTSDMKYVSVGASARYVRITAYGNTVSGWNSIAEVAIYAN